MGEQRTILVPVDFSTSSRAAIERAVVLAEARRAAIRLLHALNRPLISLDYNIWAPVWDALREAEAERLDDLKRELLDRGLSVSTILEERNPTLAIRSAMKRADLDGVVMGSHGRTGLDRLLMGSVAERAVDDATLPILIVRENAASASKRVSSILFATDFSESSRAAEAVTIDWARDLRAEVEVLHVLVDTTVLFAPYAVPNTRYIDGELRDAAEQRMARVLERFQESGIPAKARISCGYPSDEILLRAEAGGSQIIAIGSRGQTGLRRYRLGSVAQRVLRHAPCGVLVVRPPSAFRA